LKSSHAPLATIAADSSALRRLEEAGGERRKRRFVGASVLLAVGAFLSIVATGWMADRSARVVAGSVATMDCTQDALMKVDAFRAALGEAEADVRGFVITGAPYFRIGYDTASRQLVSSLAAASAEESMPRESMANVEKLVQVRVRLLRRLIAAREQNASSADINAIVADGERVSRAIAAEIFGIRNALSQRFDAQIATAASVRRGALYGPWAMCAVAALMFALMLAQAARTLRIESALRDDLRRAVAHEHAARQRAQRADRTKDRFLATVSHELRTPLTSIIGWCGLLENPSSRAALLDDALHSIAEAAKAQSRLVEDLLDISRITAGKLTLTVADTDVAEVIRKAVASMSLHAKEKQIEIRQTVPDQPARVQGDAGRLHQVVCNLLSNAIKFTPEGGVVEVDLRQTGSGLQISVRDNGAGIAPDLLPNVFDAFTQGGGSSDRKAGLGLGLAIVKNLVELHGGTVGASSAGKGRGATFIVELPGPATVPQSDRPAAMQGDVRA
jgi:signal transduction histidine kinase